MSAEFSLMVHTLNEIDRIFNKQTVVKAPRSILFNCEFCDCEMEIAEEDGWTPEQTIANVYTTNGQKHCDHCATKAWDREDWECYQAGV